METLITIQKLDLLGRLALCLQLLALLGVLILGIFIYFATRKIPTEANENDKD